MNGRETEFMWDPIWFSPCNVLYHAEKIKAVIPEALKVSKEYRKVIEMEVSAKMLLGIVKASGKDFWLQIVDDERGSPDIKSLCYTDDQNPKFDFLEVQDIEVVEYEAHSSDSLAEFLSRTKFSAKKAYDLKTHILCHVGSDTTLHLPADHVLAAEVAACNPSSPVLFIGAPITDPSKYRLMQLYPALKILEKFDVSEEFSKRIMSERRVIRFQRGAKAPLVKLEEEHYPFEKIGYLPDSDGKYVATTFASSSMG
jgi:hypothetical protein